MAAADDPFDYLAAIDWVNLTISILGGITVYAVAVQQFNIASAFGFIFGLLSIGAWHRLMRSLTPD